MLKCQDILNDCNKKKNRKNIAKNIQINESESLTIANSFFEIIKSNLAQHIVKISGFGSFQRKSTIQRIGRNPKTKEEFIIPSVSKPIFKASAASKGVFN